MARFVVLLACVAALVLVLPFRWARRPARRRPLAFRLGAAIGRRRPRRR